MVQTSKILSVGFVEGIEQAYPIDVLKTLLLDRTTGKNIIWADDEYEALGIGYMGNNQITISSITGLKSGVIKPRIAKEQEQQSLRTKSRAEVFTPSWLCNQMNNHIDSEWFKRPDVFNSEGENSWKATEENISFPDDPHKTWRDYVDCRKLEITCGEAPFICSRYDTVTGVDLSVKERIGFLDRKLRIVSENATDYNEWLKWAYRALESSYGYEYQGDNLVIARINVLESFAEHMQDRWEKWPDDSEALQATKIVSWNIWQMNGLTGAVPSDKPVGEEMQMSLFDFGDNTETWNAPFCLIYDWRARKSQTYVSLKHEGKAL